MLFGSKDYSFACEKSIMYIIVVAKLKIMIWITKTELHSEKYIYDARAKD